MPVNTRHQPETSPRGAVKPAPRESRWQAIYRETRRRILELELAPGSHLSEVSLAREFGISPTPARDALGRLSQEGLVVSGPVRGYSVAGLSISDVAQLAELRFVLESGIARLAIQRANAEALATVEEVARQLNQANQDTDQIISRNQDFHLAVARLTGNDRLVDALRRVMEDSRRLFHLGIGALPTTDMVDAHHALVDAIKAGDEAAAVAVCEAEAFGTSERVVNLLIRTGSASGRHLEVTSHDGSRAIRPRSADRSVRS